MAKKPLLSQEFCNWVARLECELATVRHMTTEETK